MSSTYDTYDDGSSTLRSAQAAAVAGQQQQWPVKNAGYNTYESRPEHAPEYNTYFESRPEYAPEVLRPDPANYAPESVVGSWNAGTPIQSEKEAYVRERQAMMAAAGGGAAGAGEGAHRAHFLANAGEPYGGRRKWDRRRWWFLAGGALGLIAVAGIVMGVVFGLGLHKKGGDGSTSSSASPSGSDSSNSGGSGSSENKPTGTSSGSASLETSACRNKNCPQILAAAVISPLVGSSSTPTRLHVFARANNSDILWRSHDTSKWVESGWTSAGDGGQGFVSEPTAISWRGPDGPRVNVMVVGPNGAVNTRYMRRANLTDDGLPVWDHTNYGTGTAWDNLGGNVASPLGLCTNLAEGGNRMDAWGISRVAQGMVHDYTRQPGVAGITADFVHVRVSEDWETGIKTDQPASSMPAVVCRDARIAHDLIYLDGSAVKHRYWDPDSKASTWWSNPVTVADGFVAHPVAIPVLNDRIDFFGLGSDKGIYTSTWTTSAGWGGVGKLGGSFQSVPTVISDGDSIEVVALGTDDKLKHAHLSNGVWSAWEDLGVFGHSAPKAVYLGGTERTVALMVIGQGRLLNFTTFSLPTDGRWAGQGKWETVEGRLSTDYMNVARP